MFRNDVIPFSYTLNTLCDTYCPGIRASFLKPKHLKKTICLSYWLWNCLSLSIDIVILKSDALSQAVLFADSCTLETPVLDLAKRCEELTFTKFPFLVLLIHSLIVTLSLAYFYVASWCFRINWQWLLYLSSSLTVTLHHFQNVPYSYRFFSFHYILFLYWNSCSWLNLLHCSVKEGVGFFQCFIAGNILI